MREYVIRGSSMYAGTSKIYEIRTELLESDHSYNVMLHRKALVDLRDSSVET